MKKLGALLLLSFAASCAKKPVDAAVGVTITFAEGAQSRCVQLVLKPTPSSERRSAPMVRNDDELKAAVRGEPGESVAMYAEGFADEGCTVALVPRERSPESSARFVSGEVTQVTLQLERLSAQAEVNCSDGNDDDGDGAVDCFDADCEAQPCANGGTCRDDACRGTTSEAGLCDDGQDNDGDGKSDCEDGDCLGLICLTPDKCLRGGRCTASGSCEGGQPLSCQSPPNGCFGSAGACFDGGCVYTPRTGEFCDDQSVCTPESRCSDAGTCTGTPITCGTPANECFTSVGAFCDPVSGCQYPFKGGFCDDAQSCTTGDRCLDDGGCAGTPTACQPNDCQTWAGSCLNDGGCDFGIRPSLTNCENDAGVCNGGGGCIPHFPFATSNFSEEQVPTPPKGTVTLGCNDAVIDTGSSGPPTFLKWCANQPLPGVATISQTGGPDAVVFSFTELDISNTGALRIQGVRPAIFAITRRATLQGSIDIQAGAMACDGGAGAPGQVNGTNGGGGGASFGSLGGEGGDGPDSFGSHGEGGAPGALEGTAELIPLRGGCAGGRGGNNGNVRAGQGGGALQISAANELLLGGVFSAAGRGGQGGQPAYAAGNGAGSGGAILLESSLITISGAAVIAANGGGGGESGGTATSGETGGNGQPNASVANGGNGSGLIVGNGGAGAAGTTPARGGENGGINSAGGGGGGGLGRIRINAAIACSRSGNSVISPAATSGLDAGCP